ncbi:MAG: energy-coupling factor transporter transmembrane protein EcfT [Actinomycetes bacterium]|jgi:energy-coupling factor transport system permease protein|nr:energy-coupling factor transporter transmembrane protein EcfT [Actinomycetes bacterium]
MKTIAAFGMYLPGNSFLHRADPRTKLVGAFILIVALFCTTALPVIVASLAVLLAVMLAARIPPGWIFRALRPIVLIVLFTLVVNAVRLSPLAFSWTGFLRGLAFSIRLIDVMLLSTMVTLTTSPVALTDGLTAMMRPLRTLRVPVDDIAMMLSIALRFIPTISQEAQIIIKAQTARGANFSTGSLFARLRAWTVVLVPLLVQLFRRADTLALAMESRCYTGQGRTRLRVLTMRTGDWATLVVIVAAAVTIAVL